MNRVYLLFFSAAIAATAVLCLDVAPSERKLRQYKYTLGYVNTYEEILDVQHADLKREFPENFNIKLKYGPGSLIIFVEIFVEQDSPISNIYVTEGGLDKNFITIDLVANHTTILNYRVVYYGH